MAKKKGADKAGKAAVTADHLLAVGRPLPVRPAEQLNYNLQPGVTEYQLWPFSTIEWVAAQGKFRARALIQQKITHDIVAINSWHDDYSDAKQAIDLLCDSLAGIGKRQVYNVFGETLEVHTADIGNELVNVKEVLGLIWSMQEDSGS